MSLLQVLTQNINPMSRINRLAKYLHSLPLPKTLKVCCLKSLAAVLIMRSSRRQPKLNWCQCRYLKSDFKNCCCWSSTKKSCNKIKTKQVRKENAFDAHRSWSTLTLKAITIWNNFIKSQMSSWMLNEHYICMNILKIKKDFFHRFGNGRKSVGIFKQSFLSVSHKNDNNNPLTTFTCMYVHLICKHIFYSYILHIYVHIYTYTLS